jgi:hypothetical protein
VTFPIVTGNLIVTLHNRQESEKSPKACSRRSPQRTLLGTSTPCHILYARHLALCVRITTPLIVTFFILATYSACSCFKQDALVCDRLTYRGIGEIEAWHLKQPWKPGNVLIDWCTQDHWLLQKPSDTVSAGPLCNDPPVSETSSRCE